MDQNPYESPKYAEKHSAPLRLQTPNTWWFWIALILLAVGIMAANQIRVMRAMMRSSESANQADQP